MREMTVHEIFNVAVLGGLAALLGLLTLACASLGLYALATRLLERDELHTKDDDGEATATARLHIAHATATYWHRAALDRGDTITGHSLAMVLTALEGETRPHHLGLDDHTPVPVP